MLILEQLSRLSDAELGARDIAETNLACALGLPGSEAIDMPLCLATLDRCARRIAGVTRRAAFERAPEHWDHSWGTYRAHAMVCVLQRDFGFRYNPAKIPADAPFGLDDSFIHGIVQGRGGTCGTLPVLYAAVGRRLGYPLKLVAARGPKWGHLFVRWDEAGGERFNVEVNNEGFDCPPDDYYRRGMYQTRPEWEETGTILKSMTPRAELAYFLAQRAACWADLGERGYEAQELACALALAPRSPLYKAFLARALREWTNALAEVRACGLPQLGQRGSANAPRHSMDPRPFPDVLLSRQEDGATAGRVTTATRFAYDGDNAWADLNGSRARVVRRLNLDSTDQPLARIDSGRTAAWFQTDPRASVRDIADYAGTTELDHIDYDGYGNVINETTPASGDRYKYTGREFDSVSGLQYNRARYYDATVGRWTSQDPIGFGARDPNLYRYVGNDPTSDADAIGLQAESSEACTITAVTLCKTNADLLKLIPTVPSWMETDDDNDMSKLGPFNDPNKTGEFNYTVCVVWQGTNLSDCKIRRYVRATVTKGDKTFQYPEGSTGYEKDQLIGETGSKVDNPNPVWIKPDKPSKILVVADSPGFKRKGIKANEFPASFKANYYEAAISEKDGKVKGEIWYEVIIETDAYGPDGVKVNDLRVLKQSPAAPEPKNKDKEC